MPPKKIPLDLSCKIPATEEQCAKDCKYTYLPTSIMSDAIKQELKACVKRDLGLTNEMPDLTCECDLDNGKCCTAISQCTTRMRQCACTNCKLGCDNNPWKNRSFAIQNDKLYLEKTENRGWGLFALKEIHQCEFLGEYTGLLTQEISYDKDVLSYQMTLVDDPSVKVYIDALTSGSAMRLVNHSCNYNANSVPYVHDGVYKTVYIARKNIKPGEEITVNYGWTFCRRTQEIYACNCGWRGCIRVLGRWDDDEDPRIVLPDIFDNISTRASRAKLEQLNASITLNKLDMKHKENHIFGPEEPVAVILLSGDALYIGHGRILECYMNNHKLVFYVVRVVSDGTTVDHHVPMWFVFRFREVAELMTTKVYSEDEKVAIKAYFNKSKNLRTHRELKRNANQYEGEILYSYVYNFLKGDLPTFVKKYRNIGGETSVGIESIYLDVVEPPSELPLPPPHSPMKTTTEFLSAADGHLLEKKLAKLKKLIKQGGRNTAANMPATDASSSHQAPASSESQTAISSDPVQDGRLPPLEIADTPDQSLSSGLPFQAANGIVAYTPNILDKMQQEFDQLTGVNDDSDLFYELIHGRHRRSVVPNGYTFCKPSRIIEVVIRNNKNVALYRRYFQHSVETLTFLTLWRSPDSVLPAFHGVYKQVEKDLYTYYYATNPRDRRFLALEHYRLCCEIVKPGSFRLRYCSICRMRENFETLDDWNSHFHQFHEIVSPWYMCDRCDSGFATRWPSDLHSHVKTCCKDLLPLIRTDLPNYKLDTFADYIALRAKNNKLSTLLKPGEALVSYEGKFTWNEEIPLVHFNPATRNPIDPTVEMEPKYFKVKATHTDMSNNVLWEVNDNEPFFYFKISNMIKRRPILPASHSVVNKENEENTTDDDFVEDIPALTRKTRAPRGKYKPRKAKTNDQNSAPTPPTSSTTSGVEKSVSATSTKANRKRRIQTHAVDDDTLPNSSKTVADNKQASPSIKPKRSKGNLNPTLTLDCEPSTSKPKPGATAKSTTTFSNIPQTTFSTNPAPVFSSSAKKSSSNSNPNKIPVIEITEEPRPKQSSQSKTVTRRIKKK